MYATVCEFQITAILEAASIRTMETWSRPAGLNDEQAKTLLDHYLECPNSRTEMVRAARNLERMIGYLTYVLATFESVDELIEDPELKQIPVPPGIHQDQEKKTKNPP